MAYILPVSVGIVLLPGIVYFSYRQTIAAYPGGGGSYRVARQNLGAMMIDYVEPVPFPVFFTGEERAIENTGVALRPNRFRHRTS